MDRAKGTYKIKDAGDSIMLLVFFCDGASARDMTYRLSWDTLLRWRLLGGEGFLFFGQAISLLLEIGMLIGGCGHRLNGNFGGRKT